MQLVPPEEKTKQQASHDASGAGAEFFVGGDPRLRLGNEIQETGHARRS
jgi:hypothetical protein